MQNERDGVIAPQAMYQMSYSLREGRAIPAESDHRNIHICKLRARRERNDATVEPVEAVPPDLVRTVTVAANIVAEAYLPRMQVQFRERILHGRPDTVVAAAVAPVAFGFRVVLGSSDRVGIQSDIHDELPCKFNAVRILPVYRCVGTFLHHRRKELVVEERSAVVLQDFIRN